MRVCAINVAQQHGPLNMAHYQRGTVGGMTLTDRTDLVSSVSVVQCRRVRILPAMRSHAVADSNSSFMHCLPHVRHDVMFVLINHRCSVQIHSRHPTHSTR